MEADPLDTEFRSGTYKCSSCGLPLYNSEDKYIPIAGTGSNFRQAISSNAVRFVDSASTSVSLEIRCSGCQARLGKYFAGLGKKSGDTHPAAQNRHLINVRGCLTFQPNDTNASNNVVPVQPVSPAPSRLQVTEIVEAPTVRTPTPPNSASSSNSTSQPSLRNSGRVRMDPSKTLSKSQAKSSNSFVYYALAFVGLVGIVVGGIYGYKRYSLSSSSSSGRKSGTTVYARPSPSL